MPQAKVYSAALFFFSFAVTLFLFASCKNGAEDLNIRKIDSISGALNQKLSELKSTDTMLLEKALSKYNICKQFIEQNISDTITKEEADNLQQFLQSGKNLEHFSMNRKTLLARGSLVNSQLAKLSKDAKETAVSDESFVNHYRSESVYADEVIRSVSVQQKVFAENVQKFRLSLNKVEALIRSGNKGQMPLLIRDSVPL